MFDRPPNRPLPPGVVVAALMAGVLAGCSSDGGPTDAGAAGSAAPVVQLGGPGETGRVLTPEEVAALATGPGHTAADVAFVAGMIHHHRQALEMIALVPDRALSSDLPLLAERMAISQTDEIALLEGWLADRGELVPTHGADGTEHGELMPGMLGADQMAALAALVDDEFDQAFLAAMITHHEGAVAMVEELIGSGGAQESSVFQLADDMGVDQAVEIASMKALLAEQG